MNVPMTGKTIFERSHWVFDLDGTLTLAVHDFNCIRSELGIPAGADILGHLSALPEETSRPLYSRLDEIEEELAHKTAAAPGALPLLEFLRRRGKQVGILTRNTRENALRTLSLIGAAGYFSREDVIGRDEALPKPDPDGVNCLLSRWGASVGEMVMVGDYLFDLQTGRAAGAATIHVDLTRKFSWPDLTDLAVGSLEELVVALEMER